MIIFFNYITDFILSLLGDGSFVPQWDKGTDRFSQTVRPFVPKWDKGTVPLLLANAAGVFLCGLNVHKCIAALILGFFFAESFYYLAGNANNE